MVLTKGAFMQSKSCQQAVGCPFVNVGTAFNGFDVLGCKFQVFHDFIGYQFATVHSFV